MASELSVTSARLRAWAEMTAAMGRDARDPGAMLRILADGVQAMPSGGTLTVATMCEGCDGEPPGRGVRHA